MTVSEELVSKYVAALTRTKISNYADSGSTYHNLLSSYENLMRSIDTSFLLETIKYNKKVFDENCKVVQIDLKKAWQKVFPDKDYPEQDSIIGIHINSCEILNEVNKAEAEKL